jgi:hypothetical protein
MDSNKFGTIRERRLDLNVVDHLGNAIHYLRAGNDARTGFHQFGNGSSVTRTLHDEIGNERDCLRVIELEASFEPTPRNYRGHGNQKLIFFARRKQHVAVN